MVSFLNDIWSFISKKSAGDKNAQDDQDMNSED